MLVESNYSARPAVTASSDNHGLADTLRRLADCEFFARFAAPGDDPVARYLESWSALGPETSLSPLFDPVFYTERYDDVADEKMSPLAHYCQIGCLENRLFHPLFDNRYYRRHFAGNPVGKGENLIVHYLNSEIRRSPTPYFDVEWYSSRYNVQPADAFEHYLKHGWPAGNSPHWAFDSAYFRSQVAAMHDREPVAAYLSSSDAIDPHPLFSRAWYKQKHSEVLDGEDPLGHYLVQGHLERREFHPLFSVELYRRGQGAPIARGQCLFRHYITHGWNTSRRPTRLFDGDFYAATNADVANAGVDTFIHYLSIGFSEGRRPHPAFDPEFYLSQVTDLAPGVRNPLVHFATTAAPRKPTVPWFDPHWYLHRSDDLKKAKVCPSRHFVESGFQESRNFGPLVSDRYIMEQLSSSSFAGTPPRTEYVKAGMYQRRRVLLLVHDAGRTGAPLIMLNIARRLAQVADIECYILIACFGPLVKDFQRYGHVYCLNRQGDRFSDVGEEIDYFLRIAGPRPFESGICGSSVVEHEREILQSHGVPTVLLFQEPPSGLDDSSFERTLSADLVVFPSEASKQEAIRRDPRARRFPVLRQGVLDESRQMAEFGSAADLREELGLPIRSKIVLGMGAVCFRKGSDLFVETAAAFYEISRQTDVYFVWVGDLSAQPECASSVRAAIRRYGLEGRVLFVGPTDKPGRFQQAASAFLLTSRADPYPCVILEAMFNGAPVVAFGRSGGVGEAVGDTGIVLDAFSTEEMARSVVRLLNGSEQTERLRERASARAISESNFDQYFNQLMEHAIPSSSLVPLNSEKSRRKVIVAASDWGISGVNTFTLHLVQQLIADGYNAELLFTRGRFTRIDENVALPDLPRRFLQPERDGPVPLWNCVRQYLGESQPCVFIPNYDYWASSVCPTLPSGVGVVGILHSDDPDHYEHYYRLGRYWNRIVAVSERIRQEAVALNPAMEEKTTVIHYGIPIVERPLRRLRRSERSPINILYTGRIVQRQKRILDFALLSKLLTEMGVDYRLTLVGDGSERKRLTEILQAEIHAGIVDLPGRLGPEEIEVYYEKADVFVLLSEFEGLPLSLLEAMECGVIPVVTDMKSGIPEVISNRRNGFVLPRGNLRAVANVVKRLHDDDLYRIEMSGRVRQSLIDLGLTSEGMATRYESVINQVFAEIESGEYRRNRPLSSECPDHFVLPPPNLVMSRFFQRNTK